jgi:hypothetical protein
LLCYSEKGGEQGNALTGQFYVINQDPALKAVQLKFPNVDIKAIQDDITLCGDPKDIFDEKDSGGVVIRLGALSQLIVELEKRGLTVNRNKCAVLGTTPDACMDKPAWLKEPTSFTSTDGTITNARGIDVCNNPIGEEPFVRAYLTEKFESICRAIEKCSTRLSPSSSHADYLAFYYSYQERAVYWLATNNLTYMDHFAKAMDEFLRKLLGKIVGSDIFTTPLGEPLSDFTAHRASLKAKNGGLGFRPCEQRYLLLNALNNTLPQAIDRADEKGVITKGLWASLSSVLGVNSFDDANKSNCWDAFHASNLSFATDHLELISRIKEGFAEVHATLAVDVPTDHEIFSVSNSSFGYGIKKLHKKNSGCYSRLGLSRPERVGVRTTTRRSTGTFLSCFPR